VRHACEPGDEVVLTNPMYGPFYSVVGDLETRPVFWELDWEDSYRFDEERLKDSELGPRALELCNPHNPMGRVVTRRELKAIAEKVTLSPGTNNGSLGEGHQRICIATSEAIIHETIDRMESR